jgi:cell division protein FtsB
MAADTKTTQELQAELEKIKAEKAALEKENSDLKANTNQPQKSGLEVRAVEFSNERL